MEGRVTNMSPMLPYGSEYEYIQPSSVIAADRIPVYNFDGLRRCAKCLCLHTNPEAHQRACRGRLGATGHRFRCIAGCTLLFSTARKAADHSMQCHGERVELDRYGTCVCPRCKVAGFAPSAITKHVKACHGSRKLALDSYRHRRPVYRCPDCGHHFLRNALCNHACGLVGDPVWLGAQPGPPDLTISAVRWYKAHGLTLGGVPGDLPASVPDETLSLRLPDHAGPNRGGEDDWNHENWLPEEDPWPGEDEDQRLDEDGDEEYAAGLQEWPEREHPGACDSATHHDATEDTSETLREVQTNDERLRQAGIKYNFFKSAPCEGLVWKHGYFACPFGSLLTIETVHITEGPTSGGLQQLRVGSFCQRCASLRRRIHKWLRESKFTTAGTRLCRNLGCREPAIAIWHCRHHANQVTRRNHSYELRRGSARTITPGEMLAFRRGLRCQLLVHPTWQVVKLAHDSPGSHAPVLYVDTESVYDRQGLHFLVCELSLVSAAGKTLLSTTVDHGLTFKELCSRTDAYMHAKLDHIYSFASPDSVTPGMTVQDIGTALERLGVSPSTTLVEWSVSGFDLLALRSTFKATLFPPRPLLGHELWRNLGLRGSIALCPLFKSAYPDSELNRSHHRSLVDAQKLRLMVAAALSHFVLLSRSSADP